MKFLTLLGETFVLSIAVTLVSGASKISEPIQDCVLRFQDNDVCACSSHDSDGPVKCHNESHSIAIQPCYCVYYDQHINKTIMGHCYYTCYRHYDTVLEITSSTNFNDDLCQFDNRRGYFCYECNYSYAMAVHGQLLIDCIPCEYYGYKNWFKYFAITLLPLTCLYVLAVLLSCNVTSSSLSGIVLVIQCIMSSALRTLPDVGVSHGALVKLVISLISVTNLEFFHLYSWSHICIHPKLNVFEVSSLAYIPALYPFLLIFATFLLVTAYDRRYRLLIWVWRPFKRCILCYRQTWDIQTSLLEMFTSFILLSSVKVMQVSLQLLSWTSVYDITGNKLKTVASMSANVEYFSSPHLPFALLALTISSVCVLLPLILLTLYPCRCFHMCLNRCGLRVLPLHMFMDAFQGSYKIRPRDMRYFSAFYLLFRVLMLAHVELFLSAKTLYISGILSLASAAVVTICRPYKVSSHNIVDSVLLLLMGIYFISCNEANLLQSLHYDHQWTLPSTLQGLSLTIIVLYFVLLIIWKCLGKKIQAVARTIKSKFNKASLHRNAMIKSFDIVTFSEGQSYPPLLGESQQATY